MFLITNDADLMKMQTKRRGWMSQWRCRTEARPSRRVRQPTRDVAQGRERCVTQRDEVKVTREAEQTNTRNQEPVEAPGLNSG